MVRVKRTGEVSEVDREVMRILRAEEKRIRRSYGSDNTSEDEDGAEKISDTVPVSYTHLDVYKRQVVLQKGFKLGFIPHPRLFQRCRITASKEKPKKVFKIVCKRMKMCIRDRTVIAQGFF